jgi:hypothetical protein
MMQKINAMMNASGHKINPMTTAVKITLIT